MFGALEPRARVSGGHDGARVLGESNPSNWFLLQRLLQVMENALFFCTENIFLAKFNFHARSRERGMGVAFRGKALFWYET